MSGTEFVTVHHPETGGVAEVSKQGYADVWKGKGWVLIEDSADLAHATKERLAEIATARGVDVSKARTKADMVKAIKEGPPSGND